ncbi:HpcH/HpaI aldolase/citrate lyase family protein [Galbitalea soli]|uniref:CoA ester lyase n=1 Tax=Galbitalea soli TaxID=1268042 RepID=A0A7C9PNV7_9MICO|nr:CoA ester lyase [Galbitalea soli]NEM91953.1 CoA ester lyase [Galbitalea soli]NYJ32099.1 citrate lyase subunit beta/citryl-CoA lyase [Galbitalea soli]
MMREHDSRVRLAASDARSWLLVNATAGASFDFDDAHRSPADQVILDLEDAVDPGNKPSARLAVAAWLSPQNAAWVRINAASTPFWEEDLEVLAGHLGLAGVVLAKAETAKEVVDTVQRLGTATPVIPLIESAVGIELAVSIATVPGVARLAFGSGDYRRDTGTANDNLAMAYPRSRLVIASRIGGLPGPIDGPTVGSSHPQLREQAAVSVALGMTGKLCLDLEQPRVINECMSPSPSDVAWALEFLADFERGGRVIRDGSDKPRLARAETISERAARFGVAAG